MFPGLSTKISEENLALSTTCNVRRDLVHITSTVDTTVMSTVLPQFGGGFSGLLIVVNRSGNNVTSVTTGNIAKAVTIPTNQTCLFVYSKSTGKWYPGAIS